MNNSIIIKNFAPSWFASVMGTGIVAITSFYYAFMLPPLKEVAITLWLLNTILFVLLIVPWGLRFILYSTEALSDLKNPVTGQFYATMPIACLVLAANFLLIGDGYLNKSLVIAAAKGLWLTGVAISLLLSLAIPLINFLNKNVTVEQLNPAWFMPPVSLIVIPVPGAKLLPYWPGNWQEIIFIFNLVAWSSGFFLFILIETICFYRFICRPPLPGQLAPTTWINLGPIGVGTIALINMGLASPSFLGENVLPVIKLMAIILWGFGFWWILCAICLSIYYLMHRNLQFSLSWWAFTFPLGAYTGATYLIAGLLDAPLIASYGFGCYILLVVLWSIVFARSVAGVVKLEFFKAGS